MKPVSNTTRWECFSGPIQFTKEEIDQAKAGNSGPIEKRLKREQSVRSRMYAAVGRPRKQSQLKPLVEYQDKKFNDAPAMARRGPGQDGMENGRRQTVDRRRRNLWNM